MTSAICNASTEHETKQLKDTRDNKLYWVTKLKDGNCWMTQNLAYNGGGTSRGTNCSGWTNDNTVAQYCNPGHTNGDHASRGNYYSWPAAMNGDTFATGTVQGICSNGWHLPTKEVITTLKETYGYTTVSYVGLQNEPMYFLAGGFVQADGIESVNMTGNYWTSVPNGSTSAIYVTFNRYAGSSSPDSNSHQRFSGYSVRCLAN